MSQQTTRFEDLLQLVAQGSDDAAWEIVQKYSPNILRAVRASLPQEIRGKLDSVDIVQSVWISLLTNMDRMSELDTPQRFVAYMVAVARTKVTETHRRFTRVKARDVHREERLHTGWGRRLEDERFVARDATASAVAQVREAWDAALRQCSPRDEAVVRMRLQGYTNEQIAEELQLSTRTIRRIVETMIERVVI